MFESLQGICDYNESYFARRAMLIELRSATFSNKFAMEYGKIIGALLIKKKLLHLRSLQNLSFSIKRW